MPVVAALDTVVGLVAVEILVEILGATADVVLAAALVR